MPSQAGQADLEIRILKQEANGYPVEITVNTETGQQEFGGGFLNPNEEPGPGVAAAGYADKTYGLALFNWLLADPTLQKQWAAVAGEHKQRRIRLRIAAEAPELHQYPWEAVCDLDGPTGGLRLAAADATPFSRYMAGKQLPGKPIISRPIKILVAIANPDDLDEQDPPLDPISLQTEWDELNQALQAIKGSSVEVGRLGVDEPCTLQRLVDELRKGYHILHLVCHGAASSHAAPGTPGSAVLFLADDNNKVNKIKDEAFAEQLALQLANANIDDEKKLRLVFLASCQTAKRSAYDAFRGVAPQLVNAGVPAVLAMQDNIGQEAARTFAKAFYTRLLEHGQVDLATNQARQSLLAEVKEANKAQLAIPTLFLRLRNGQLLGNRGVVSDQGAAKFWPSLLRNIDDGLCTVFLGPRLNAGGIADTTAIAKKLAIEYGYPLQDNDNWVRVAQFVALNGRTRLRNDYLREVKRSVLRGLGVKPQNNENEVLRTKNTSEVLNEYKWTEQVRSIQEDEPHFLLADLPIGLYMTTNMDSLMYTALSHKFSMDKAKAEADPNNHKGLETGPPRREQPRWKQLQVGSPQYSLTPDPDPHHPVVFHLNGFDEDPNNLVLSEDDYMRHLIHLMDAMAPILPTNLTGNKLAQDSLVFIGFALDDWEFRLILHGLLNRIDQKQDLRHVGVQLEVGPVVDKAREADAKKYLEDYLGSYRIDIYWGTPGQFVNELHSRWKHYLETGDENW